MVAQSITSDAIPRPVDPERVDQRWRCLEERVTAPDGCYDPGPEDVDAEIQYVWGERYVDELLFRDRDTTGDGDFNERLWALQDANWNVVALADDNGAVQERYAYDGYGRPNVLNADFTAKAGGTGYDWEFLFTGRRMDLETELMYYRNRYYHVGLGRFITRDPIGYEGVDFSLYRYCGNSPLDTVDPKGHKIVNPKGGGWVNTSRCMMLIPIGHTNHVEAYVKNHEKHRRKTRKKAGETSDSCFGIGPVACCTSWRFKVDKEFIIPEWPQTSGVLYFEPAATFISALIDFGLRSLVYYRSFGREPCCCKSITVRVVCDPDASYALGKFGRHIEVPLLNTTVAKLCGGPAHPRKEGAHVETPLYVEEYHVKTADIPFILGGPPAPAVPEGE